jgi:hypothetical protein
MTPQLSLSVPSLTFEWLDNKMSTNEWLLSKSCSKAPAQG